MKTDSTAAAGELERLWDLAGGAADALDRVVLTGDEPALPGLYKVGVQAQAAIAATGLAAAELHRARGGPAQDVAVSMRHAAAAFRSEQYVRLDGKPTRDFFDSIHGFYKCGDGGWVQVHANYPAHRMAVAELLHCAYSREGVQRVFDGMAAQAVEDLLAANRLPVGRMRSEDEWAAHPQAAALDAQPVLILEKIGEAPPRPLPPVGARPLEGLRVLDLTKVIAGPVCGRTLAEHGADVLQVTAAHLAHVMPLVIDANRGKRSAYLDLRKADQVERLKALAADADVFAQGYRPGTLAARGLGPEHLAAIRPGIVYVSLSAFGHQGPWAARRGFDSIVQTCSGIGHAGGVAVGKDGMKHLPCQALDHASGYLMALGAIMGRLRQAQEGGSWLARVSLARTGRWLQSLGKQDAMGADDMTLAAIGDLIEDYGATAFGHMTGVKPAAELSATPGHWATPTVPPGAHAPEWR
ncbi:MAG: CoA transferase [Alphaproteobacteria bacterium]|nr:CoA transferase [Alphaproteobacteria bacterium]MCB9931134.1 CoA transferase [Alphaproteobacteria bacterium]